MLYRWNNGSEYRNTYELQAKVWVTESNGKYADMGGNWVTIYQDLLNERQITFSLTDGNNATDVERRLENVTNDVFYKFRVRAINKFGKSDWSQSSRAMNVEEILKRAQSAPILQGIEII